MNSPHAYFDIAIVELDRPVELGLQVEPLCLPDLGDYKVDSMRGHSATLTGYGPNLQSDKSTELNQITQTIEGQRLCSAKYDSERTVNPKLRSTIETALPEMFKDTLVCAGNALNSRVGTCAGDSGGPLIMYKTDLNTFKKTFFLFAVLYGGVVNCDNSVYPSIYNTVALKNTYDWILDIMSGQPTRGTTCKLDEFRCKSGKCMYKGCSGPCIPKDYVNDGEQDCSDGSDEKPLLPEGCRCPIDRMRLQDPTGDFIDVLDAVLDLAAGYPKEYGSQHRPCCTLKVPGCEEIQCK